MKLHLSEVLEKPYVEVQVGMKWTDDEFFKQCNKIRGSKAWVETRWNSLDSDEEHREVTIYDVVKGENCDILVDPKYPNEWYGKIYVNSAINLDQFYPDYWNSVLENNNTSTSWQDHLPTDVFNRLSACRTLKKDILPMAIAYWNYKLRNRPRYQPEDALIAILEWVDCNGQDIDFTVDEYKDLVNDLNNLCSKSNSIKESAQSDKESICVKYKGNKYSLKELSDYALSLGDSIKNHISSGYLIICTDDVHIYYLNNVAKQLGLSTGVKVAESCKESIYTDNGFSNRKDYLNSLADDFGVDKNTVYDLASVLGPEEDFDALVTELEDMADDLEETEDFDPIKHYLDKYAYVVCSTDNTYENFDFIFPYDTYEFAGKELARDLIEYETETCIFDTRNKTKTDYSPDKLDISKLDEGGRHGWVEDDVDYIDPEIVGKDAAIENIRSILDMCEVKTEKY